MEIIGAIMAGGGGTRFWPLSRRRKPKQLLNLSGNDLMINETIDRITKVIDNQNIYVITNVNQGGEMHKAIEGRIPTENMILEPAARNTAACIGYAAVKIEAVYGEGIMCVFPADHYIRNEEKFSEVLKEAICQAEKSNSLLTIGIEPEFPSTGYGYINYDQESVGKAKLVKCFVEKPNLEKAKEYISDGNYLWNSGMFVWKTSVILGEIKKYIPEVYEKLMVIKNSIGKETETQVINEIYPTIPKISIDYGIMERSDIVMVLPGEFGWDDVGSWDTLEAMHNKDDKGNIFIGKHAEIDTSDCVIYSQEKLVATLGISNVVVVETGNAILVCDKSKAQEVKKIVEYLEDQNLEEYL